MNTQKFLLSGIAGGIVSFFAGYLLYGLLLMDFFTKNVGSATNVMRPPAEMIWWAMILGSVCFGLVLSYVFTKWANIQTAGAGATAGFVISLFMTAGFDFMMYGQTNISNLQASFVDIICGAVLGAVSGAVVGLVNGMGKKAA